MTPSGLEDWQGLPGAELVLQGLRDLEAGRRTEQALLLQVAAPRLRRLGIEIPSPPLLEEIPAGHQLYTHLEESHGPEAHSRYNGLLRRITSFTQALERESCHRDPPHQAASAPGAPLNP